MCNWLFCADVTFISNVKVMYVSPHQISHTTSIMVLHPSMHGECIKVGGGVVLLMIMFANNLMLHNCKCVQIFSLFLSNK